MDPITIIVGLVSLALGTTGSFFTFRARQLAYKEQLEKKNKELESVVKDLSAPMVLSLSSLNKLQEKVYEIFEASCSTRFLILVATNGKTDLKRATVVYEQHQTPEGTVNSSIGASGRFINFEFDSVYRTMLKDIEHNGPKNFVTVDMEDGDLKDIYISEHVTASKVFFLRRTKIDENNDRVWYCSIATHNVEGFKEEGIIAIKSYMSQIKELIEALPIEVQ
jgi:hypothetical protein